MVSCCGRRDGRAGKGIAMAWSGAASVLHREQSGCDGRVSSGTSKGKIQSGGNATECSGVAKMKALAGRRQRVAATGRQTPRRVQVLPAGLA
eukprot:scaffold25722_cov109-Isochrysis_galbana.AAC.1